MSGSSFKTVTYGSSDILDQFASIMLGFYLIAVFYRGNSNAFIAQAKTESGYLEFALSGAAVYYILKYDRTGIAAPFITLAGLGALLVRADVINLGGITERFAKGQIGLFETIKEAIGK